MTALPVRDSESLPVMDLEKPCRCGPRVTGDSNSVLQGQGQIVCLSSFKAGPTGSLSQPGGLLAKFLPGPVADGHGCHCGSNRFEAETDAASIHTRRADSEPCKSPPTEDTT